MTACLEKACFCLKTEIIKMSKLYNYGNDFKFYQPALFVGCYSLR